MIKNRASYRTQWFTDAASLRKEILAGILVALALIPEALGFSIIAGVDPRVGLYASVSIAIVVAFTGGRTGMISAATAAVAVLVAPLVRDHGVEYLFAATILMGLIQIIASLLRVDLLMQYVSRSVITGFVNALAIMIFAAQLPQLFGAGWHSYAMVAAGMMIIYLMPRFTKAVPAPLVAILSLAALSIYFGLPVKNVADMGDIPSGLPSLALPNVPLSLETLQIILPFSITMAAVGLLESLLVAQIIDDKTDSISNKQRECAGQGSANIVAALCGGMGGCAMIGQSMINLDAGARYRLSTFTSGAFLLLLLTTMGSFVGQLPIPALVAVMLVVSISTFQWDSLRDLRHHPLSSTIVMLTTVFITLATRDLSLGVLAGVLLSGIFFAAKVRRMFAVDHSISEDGARIHYSVTGQLFFATTQRFTQAFTAHDAQVKIVEIDLTHAHFWDISAVGALDQIVAKLHREGRHVHIKGFNEASAIMIDKFAAHDQARSAVHSPLP